MVAAAGQVRNEGSEWAVGVGHGMEYSTWARTRGRKLGILFSYDRWLMTVKEYSNEDDNHF